MLGASEELELLNQMVKPGAKHKHSEPPWASSLRTHMVPLRQRIRPSLHPTPQSGSRDPARSKARTDQGPMSGLGSPLPVRPSKTPLPLFPDLGQASPPLPGYSLNLPSSPPLDAHPRFWLQSEPGLAPRSCTGKEADLPESQPLLLCLL